MKVGDSKRMQGVQMLVLVQQRRQMADGHFWDLLENLVEAERRDAWETPEVLGNIFSSRKNK